MWETAGLTMVFIKFLLTPFNSTRNVGFLFTTEIVAVLCHLCGGQSASFTSAFPDRTADSTEDITSGSSRKCCDAESDPTGSRSNLFDCRL